jgi:hypothetical protein
MAASPDSYAKAQKIVRFCPCLLWQLFAKLSIRPATTPAVGVNFILAPNMELFLFNFTCGQRKWPYPHPDVH